MRTPGVNDEERFRRLYGDTSRKVYGFLRRRCDHDTAETVLSDVYLKAWRHFRVIDQRDPMGWLLTTARTSLIDLQRSRSRDERLIDDLACLVRHDDVITIEGGVVERTVLMNAMADLNDLDREAC